MKKYKKSQFWEVWSTIIELFRKFTIIKINKSLLMEFFGEMIYNILIYRT